MATKIEYLYKYKYGGETHLVGTSDPDFKFDKYTTDALIAVFSGVAKITVDKKEKYTWDGNTLVSVEDVTLTPTP